MKYYLNVYGLIVLLGFAIIMCNSSCLRNIEGKTDKGSNEVINSTIKDSIGKVNNEPVEIVKIYFDSVTIIRPFNKNGLALIEDRHSRWNFATRSGELIMEWQDYEFNTESDNGIDRFCNGAKIEKWGYLNKTGSVYIPFTYDFAYPFSEGLAAVVKNNKLGFIDSKGELKIDYLFDFAHDFCMFSEGLARVSINGKDLYINKNGKIVIPAKYQFCDSYFSEGLAYVKDSLGNAFYIDMVGTVVIDLRSKNYFVDLADNQFSNNRLCVQDNRTQKYGYADTKGVIVIDCKFDDAFGFRNGLAAVYDAKVNLWGFINSTGKVVIPYKYSTMTDADIIAIPKAYGKN